MIPVNEPLLDDRDMEYVTECIRTGWVSSAGKFLNEFEEKWANYCGRRYGIAVSNGTVALQLSVACIDIEPGDEIIMPTFTIISCPLAAIYNGGVPVLVDSDPYTWCMDVNQIEKKITPRTRAIMPVHIYGHPVDMDPILELAAKYGLVVIEDAAQVHGAEYLSSYNLEQQTWRRCGSFGTFSCFSFYANKLITTGEGGMLLTDDSDLAEKARSRRNLCFKSDRRYHHTEMGFNFRLTNLQAALGAAQTDRMKEIIVRKRFIAQEYTRRLKDIEVLQLPIEKPWARSVYWMYGVVLSEDTGMDVLEFSEKLKKRGVDTRPFFLGIHEQPVFRKQGLFSNEGYPVAERLARQGLYLPSGLALREEQLQEVCESIKSVLT